jgi:hypothetical protein
MRATFALYVEISLDWLLPGFFDRLAELDFGQSVDRGAARARLEFARLEIENLDPEHLADARQVVEAAARDLMVTAASRYGLPANWQEFGRVAVALVEDAPNVNPGHSLNAANPAVRCPQCEQPMVKRVSRGRQFYGCQAYPTCHGTRPISA